MSRGPDPEDMQGKVESLLTSIEGNLDDARAQGRDLELIAEVRQLVQEIRATLNYPD